MNAMLSLQRLALPLTFAQLAFAANTFVTSLFLSRSSTTALHASLPGSMLAVAVSSLALSALGYSGTVFADRHGSGDTPGALAAFRSALAVAIRLRPLECRARQMCRADFRTLISLGVPNGVRAVIDIGGFFVFTAILAEREDAAVAASTAAFAVNGIYQALPQGLSQALEIMTARAARENRSALLAPALRLVAIHALAFIAVLSLFGRELLDAFASKGDASFADGFSATAKTLVLILCAKAVFESAVQVLQAHLRGRGETAAVFRIQCATSLLFWIPLFLAVRAFSPGIPAYWLTMLASAALASAALFLTQARLPSATRTPRRP